MQLQELPLASIRALPGVDYILIVYGAACLLLGLAGFLLSVRWQGKPPTPVAP